MSGPVNSGPFCCDQDEEDFLFEKGELNLWAEPLQWVQLLHRHLRSLLARLGQNQVVDPDQLGQIQTQARAKLLASQQALDRLPELPQFCCAADHTRLTLRRRRAELVLDLLHGFQATGSGL